MNNNQHAHKRFCDLIFPRFYWVTCGSLFRESYYFWEFAKHSSRSLIVLWFLVWYFSVMTMFHGLFPWLFGNFGFVIHIWLTLKVRDRLLHCTKYLTCTPSSKGEVWCCECNQNLLILVFNSVSRCPGPGSSWGDLAVPPPSKEGESPSHPFYSILFYWNMRISFS